MDFAVVAATERNGELVADLAAKRSVLGEAQMMGVRRLAATDETGLPGNKLDVFAVADASGLWYCERAFVNCDGA